MEILGIPVQDCIREFIQHLYLNLCKTIWWMPFSIGHFLQHLMEFTQVVPSSDSYLDVFLTESCTSFANSWWEARWVQYSRRVEVTDLLGGPEATASSNNDLWAVVGEFLVRWVCTITKPLLTLTAKWWINVLFWHVHVKPANSTDAVMQTCQCIFGELILWDLSWRND